MRAVLISHNFLNHNIMIIMEEDIGITIDLETGYKTDWRDESGEDEISNIALDWLKYQSYIRVPVNKSHSPEYTGHYWWNRESKATVDERVSELKNMLSEIY